MQKQPHCLGLGIPCRCYDDLVGDADRSTSFRAVTWVALCAAACRDVQLLPGPNSKMYGVRIIRVGNNLLFGLVYLTIKGNYEEYGICPRPLLECLPLRLTSLDNNVGSHSPL